MSEQNNYYHLELAAMFLHSAKPAIVLISNSQARLYLNNSLIILPVDDLPPGVSRQAIEESLFAKVFVPYHPPGGAGAVPYGYTFHLFGLGNSVPALYEMVMIKNVIDLIHADYHQLARLEIGQPPLASIVAEK